MLFGVLLVGSFAFARLVPHLPLTWGGLVAQEPSGLIGIATAPVRHLDVVHLWTNAVLGVIAAYCAFWGANFPGFLVSLPFLWTLPQVLPWFLLPQGSVLLGASGVICAFAGFAVMSLYDAPEGRGRMYLALGVFALFVVQLFIGEHVSVSAHLGGFAVGVVVAGVWRLVHKLIWRRRGA